MYAQNFAGVLVTLLLSDSLCCEQFALNVIQLLFCVVKTCQPALGNNAVRSFEGITRSAFLLSASSLNSHIRGF